MSAEACAEIVRRGDPDRWRAAMAAPPEKRPGLMALHAFNLEIARAPWAASEPLLAEIRLTWWREAVDEIAAGRPPRRHEVVGPLAETIRGARLPRRLFAETIAARMIDAQAEALPDRAAVLAHVDATWGHMTWLAALHLGAPGQAERPVRDFARGAGLAALLRALPELRARSRDPLPAGLAVAGLAREGLEAIAEARTRRGAVPAGVLPALLPGWLAETRLRMVVADPDRVSAGGLEVAPVHARARLLWTAATGRW